jgi:hypothetical protein
MEFNHRYSLMVRDVPVNSEALAVIINLEMYRLDLLGEFAYVYTGICICLKNIRVLPWHVIIFPRRPGLDNIGPESLPLFS